MLMAQGLSVLSQFSWLLTLLGGWGDHFTTWSAWRVGFSMLLGNTSVKGMIYGMCPIPGGLCPKNTKDRLAFPDKQLWAMLPPAPNVWVMSSDSLT